MRFQLPSLPAVCAPVTLGLFLAITPALSAAMIIGDPADATASRQSNADLIVSGSVSSNTLTAGFTTTPGAGRIRPIFVFQLPMLGTVSEPFTDVSLTLNLESKLASTDYSMDLVAVGTRDEPTVLGSDAGATAGSVFTPIQSDFLTTSTPFGAVTTSAAGSLNLTAFLNAAYAGGANAGDYVFFRVQYTGSFQNENSGYVLTSANAENNQPFLTYTAVPEPGSAMLLAAGLGAVLIGRARMRR